MFLLRVDEAAFINFVDLSLVALRENVTSIRGVIDSKLAAVLKVNRRNVIRDAGACDLVKRNFGQVDKVAAVGAADCVGAVAVRVEESILARAAN